VASIGTRFITANGIVQHVAVAGAANAPVVLLVHGLGWDHTLWRPEIDLLAASGWRVIAPDLRGMGKSDKPDVPYSIGLYASDLLALLDELAIARCALVGFSLGGMIGLAMAVRKPQRIGAALIACASPVTTQEGAAATEAVLGRAEKLGPTRFAEEQAEAIWRGEWARDHAAEVKRFIAWRAAMDQAALARVPRRVRGRSPARPRRRHGTGARGHGGRRPFRFGGDGPGADREVAECRPQRDRGGGPYGLDRTP